MDASAHPKYVKVAVLESVIEAQLIDSILNEQHILHRIRSYHDTAYDGLFQFQKGWGALWTPEKSKEAVLEVLENIRSEKQI